MGSKPPIPQGGTNKHESLSAEKKPGPNQIPPEDVLTLSGTLLAEVNRALDERFMELPEDVRALLVQKGALTQTVIRELTHLIELAADKAEKHDSLLDKIGSWQEEFFLPLKDQSDGKPVVKEIYLRDLESMIEELNKALAERDG